MRAAFFTLGCKVNQYETSVMEQAFSAGGFDIVSPEEDADVYVVNSCTVTSAGDKKSRQALRRFRRQNPSAVICLCGCFPQAFPADAARIPEADIVMGQKNRAGLVGAVMQRLAGEGRIVDINPHEDREAFEPMSAGKFRERTRAFLKIQDGCERRCAYCVIPRARGPVRSKPPEAIVSELKSFAEAGYREVVLAGINLSSYGRDIGLRLTDAVSLACSGGIERVRLSSLEPDLLTAGDIERLASMEKLCPHFHLSLQSGCDRTLKRMRRHYDSASYARLVENIKTRFTNPAITTDIMTGFPGESTEDHLASIAFAKSIGFAKVHVFAYSARPGTAAASFDGQIDKTVKAQRSRGMNAAMKAVRRVFLASQSGTAAQVLFESCENGIWRGYSENYSPVEVVSGENLANKIRGVAITGAKDDVCGGVLL